MLCPACQAFARSVLDQDFTTWKQYPEDEGIRIEFVHTDRDAIFQNAATGCHFCKFFNAAPSSNQNDPCFIKTVSWGEPENGVFHFIFSSGKTYHNIAEFQVFIVPNQSEQILATQDLQDKLPYCPPPRLDPPQCLSAWPLSLVHVWRKRCQQIHPACTRTETPVLPTRVIDVRTSSGRPRLFVSNGVRAEYVTLSYCWGQAGHIRTVTENFDDHQKGIEMNILPRTLRDAIEMIRALGFRYIWIDALCIIQNDDDDWRREAAKMASVYRDGSICLSILDSANSDAGFLINPQVDQFSTQLDGVDLAIRTDRFLAMGPREGRCLLEMRAWCLQERLLAPVLLHFEDNQFMWECNSAFASEAFPRFRNDIAGPPHGLTLNRTLTNDKPYVSGSRLGADTTLWYGLVADYTHRLLSRRSDRLVGIQGLARRIQVSMGRASEYYCGLWMKDIHRGLLWNVNIESSFPTECDQANPPEIPTWSWASVHRGVNFAGRHSSDRSLKFEADIRKGDAGADYPGSTETSISGANTLLVDTCYLEGNCCLAEPRYRTPKQYPFEFETRRSDHPHLPCNLDRLDGSVSNDTVSPYPYRCILISAAMNPPRFGQRIVALYYLILEEASDSSHGYRGFKTFRRAGKGVMTYLIRDCIEYSGYSPLEPFETAKKEKVILI